MSMSELHAEQQGQDDMMECVMHHETSRAKAVLDEIVCIIRSEIISEEDAIKAIRESDNVRNTQ